MIYLRLDDIKRTSQDRPEGYLESVLSVSKVVGDIVEIADSDYAELLSIYQPSKFTGLGDAIKWLTDKLGITQCGGCKKRQKSLNNLFPFS